MDLASFGGPEDQMLATNISANSNLISVMAMVHTSSQTVMFSQVDGKWGNSKVRVIRLSQMEIFWMGAGKMGTDMEFSFSHFPMELGIRLCMLMEPEKEGGMR